MPFIEPQYNSETVDLAGQALICNVTVSNRLVVKGIDQLEVINNRRAAHAYPMNTFQATLRQRAFRIDPTAIIATRTKRLSSIQDKLQRYDWLTLSEMQDIAGCRAVVSSVDQVDELVDVYSRKHAGHGLLRTNDYIRSPKPDGYRSYHLIYEYCNSTNPICDGLKIEIQLRSVLQLNCPEFAGDSNH